MQPEKIEEEPDSDDFHPRGDRSPLCQVFYCYGHIESAFKSIACPLPKDVNGQIACEFVEEACSHSI
jgi:hypothetical protein